MAAAEAEGLQRQVSQNNEMDSLMAQFSSAALATSATNATVIANSADQIVAEIAGVIDQSERQDFEEPPEKPAEKPAEEPAEEPLIVIEPYGREFRVETQEIHSAFATALTGACFSTAHPSSFLFLL